MSYGFIDIRKNVDLEIFLGRLQNAYRRHYHLIIYHFHSYSLYIWPDSHCSLCGRSLRLATPIGNSSSERFLLIFQPTRHNFSWWMRTIFRSVTTFCMLFERFRCNKLLFGTEFSIGLNETAQDCYCQRYSLDSNSARWVENYFNGHNLPRNDRRRHKTIFYLLTRILIEFCVALCDIVTM